MMSLWQAMFVCIFLLSCSTNVNSQFQNTATSDAVDLLFLIDSSYYITEVNFRTVLKSVLNFIETLPVGADQVNVAAISYSVVPKRIDFTGDIQLLRTSIPTLFYDGQAALTHVGFDEALTAMTAQKSLRPSARKVVILVTESISLYPAESRRSADRLRNAGVEIWAVGIGPYVRQLELLDFTGNISRTFLSDVLNVLPPINLGLSGRTSLVQTLPATLTVQTSSTISLLFSELSSTQIQTEKPSSIGSKDMAATVVVTSTDPASVYISTSFAPSTYTFLTPTPAVSDSSVSSVLPGPDPRDNTNNNSDSGAGDGSTLFTSFTASDSTILLGTTSTNAAAATSPTMQASSTINFFISELRSTQILTGTPASQVMASFIVPSTSASMYLTATPTANIYTSVTPTASAYTSVNPTAGAYTSVNPTAGAYTSVNSTAGAYTSVNPTAGAYTSVNPTAGAYTSVNPTAGAYTSVNPTAGAYTSVNPTAGAYTSVNPTATAYTSINPTSTAYTSVNPTAGAYTSVNPTATAYTSVNPTAGAYTSVNPTASVYTSMNPTATVYTFVTPSATESDPPMSSVLPGLDPRNNTNDNNDNDGSGDGTIVFNSSTDGICIHAVALKGFGYVPHPRDCDKFIQCHRSQDGTVTASVRFCPRGLFWKQANLTCVQPDQTCCSDPCTEKCQGQTYRMDGGCDLYWQCIKGVSRPKKCMSYHSYIPGIGCVFMPTCVNTDTSTQTCPLAGKCEYLPLANNLGYRLQTISGSIVFNCWASTEFDLATCSCRPLKDLIKNCPLVNYFNITSEAMANNSVTNNSTTQIGCKASGVYENTENSDNTDCSTSDVLAASSDSTRAVTLQFRYFTSTNRSSSSTPEVLVRSNACVQEEAGILVVTEDATSLNVKVLSPIGYVLSASVPVLGLNQTECRDVYIQYFRGNLFVELSSGNVVYNIYSKGGMQVPVGACGWKVGAPDELADHLSVFTGDISEVLVSRCNEYGF